MNKSVVIFGSLLISIGFIGGFYYLLNLRSENIQNQNTTPEVTRVEIPTTGLTPKITDTANKEVGSFDILIRGTIVNYEASTQQLSLLMYNPAKQQDEGLVEVSVKNVGKLACWVSPIDPASGKVMGLKNAYFPMDKDSILFLKDEKIVNQPSWNDYSNKFAFIKLQQSVKLDTTPEADQISILDC